MYHSLNRGFFALIGYLYLRLRHGKYHKRILITDYAREYYYAGLTVVWMPVLFVAIIVLSWALINVGIFLLS